jgi:hypothetical protein
MKIRICLIALATCLLLVLSVHALTRQWSVPSDSAVLTLITDGKGGCAIVSYETNGAYSVIWVDQKGQEKYRKTFPVGTQVTVCKCSKKELFYTTTATSGQQLVQVDKKGNEQTATEPATLSYCIGQFKCDDAKGVFLIVMNTNQGPQRAEVVRYSSK